MKLLALNIFLALIWIALTGDLHPVNILAGFGLGYVFLRLVDRVYEEKYPTQFDPAVSTLTRVQRWVSFIVYFVYEVIIANVQVVRLVIASEPKAIMRPGFVAVPLDLKSDLGITVMANFITLTPGTLSVDVSDDRKTLYVHGINVNDPEQFRAEVKESLERRVMEVFE